MWPILMSGTCATRRAAHGITAAHNAGETYKNRHTAPTTPKIRHISTHGRTYCRKDEHIWTHGQTYLLNFQSA